MRTRARFVAALVAGTVLSGSAAVGRAQSGAAPGCPPSNDPLQLCLTVRPAHRLGRVVDPATYAYPFHDPVMATITVAALNPDGVTPGLKREVLHVPVVRGRDHLPLLEGRADASLAFYRQKHAAPLMFILAGIGSNPYFGLGTYYAQLFHKQGAHVVILPSPMTWNFALAASRSGAPGFPPDDARDLYQLMQSTLSVLRARGVEVTGVDFMGASLGALEGAYLSVLDAQEGRIGIEQYLLLNPPIDLGYALDKLSAWEALGGKLGPERRVQVRMKALGLFESYMQDRADDQRAITRAARDFSQFSTEELQFLVSQAIRIVMPELVYVTQALHDQHVLATPRDQGRTRLREAKRFSLKDYEEKIAVPLQLQQGRPGADADSLRERGSLTSIAEQLRDNPRVHIMHNADDVLADPASIVQLKEIMGDRMTLYPSGGHLGNLWYPENRDSILGYFQATIARHAQRSGRPVYSTRNP